MVVSSPLSNPGPCSCTHLVTAAEAGGEVVVVVPVVGEDGD